MYVIHGVALVGPFLVRFSWGYVALAFALYLARMLALSGAYHRYFAHRSYKTGRCSSSSSLPRRHLRPAGGALVGRQPPAPPPALRRPH
jgi:hypothetical protein